MYFDCIGRMPLTSLTLNLRLYNPHNRVLLHLFLIYQLQSTSSLVLRINEAGLDDLAEYTRQWMFDSLRTTRMDNFVHPFDRGLASGELNLNNLSIVEFSPPLIKYRPHVHDMLYISTVGGAAEIHADWAVKSNVLSVLGIPLHGIARGKISGFRSTVAVRVVNKNGLAVDQCIARFGDFDLHLTGSLAAEVLHWFRGVIGKIMQARVEQTYCKIISVQMLPWLKTQLNKLPQALQFNFGDSVNWSQNLHAIRTTETHIDLQMKNSFLTNGHLIESVSKVPPAGAEYEPGSRDGAATKAHVVEVYLDEQSLQEMITASHFSGELVTNISSPFLSTDCEVLCLGKVVPELRQAIGLKKLYAEVFTNEPPLIKLVQNEALLHLNVTFGLYEKDEQLKDAFDLDILNDSVHDARQDNQWQNGGYARLKNVRQAREDPVVQIHILSEALIHAEMVNREMEIELNLQNSKARLLSSKIGSISQKTVDVILSMSVPFLENSASYLMGNGARMEQVLNVPCQNETMLFENGFVHFMADLNIRNLL